GFFTHPRAPVRNTAKPRFATAPTKGSQLAQKPILVAAAALGTPALPWQKRAIRLIGERRPATADEADQFYDMAKRQGANKHELEKLRRQIAGGIPRYR